MEDVDVTEDFDEVDIDSMKTRTIRKRKVD